MHAQRKARAMRQTLLWTSCNSCDHEGVSLSMYLAKAFAPYKHDTRRDSYNWRICTRKTHHQQAATAEREEQSQCKYSGNVYNYTSVYRYTFLYIYISTYLYICEHTYIYASMHISVGTRSGRMLLTPGTPTGCNGTLTSQGAATTASTRT